VKDWGVGVDSKKRERLLVSEGTEALIVLSEDVSAEIQ